MKISLSKLIVGKDLPDILLRGIATDSREIKQDELFVSLSGHTHEGNDFISDALSKGAAAVAQRAAHFSADPRPISC